MKRANEIVESINEILELMKIDEDDQLILDNNKLLNNFINKKALISLCNSTSNDLNEEEKFRKEAAGLLNILKTDEYLGDMFRFNSIETVINRWGKGLTTLNSNQKRLIEALIKYIEAYFEEESSELRSIINQFHKTEDEPEVPGIKLRDRTAPKLVKDKRKVA